MAWAEIPDTDKGFEINWNEDLIINRKDKVRFDKADIEKVIGQEKAEGFTTLKVLIKGQGFEEQEFIVAVATQGITQDGFRKLLYSPNSIIAFACPPFRRRRSFKIQFKDLFIPVPPPTPETPKNLLNKGKKILDNVQAGILKPYKRTITKFYFIKFSKDQKSVSNWTNQLDITSMSKQFELRDKYKEFTDDPANKGKSYEAVDNNVITNFYLSAYGFKKLGDLSSKLSEIDGSFLDGMKDEQMLVNHNDKPKFKGWQQEYKEDIDALLVLAASSKNALNKKLKSLNIQEKNDGTKIIVTDGKTIGEIIIEENGVRLTKKVKDGNPYQIEPFGYRDGISKIQFFEKNGKLKNKKTDLVLDDDFGSYLVFRKLKQHVKRFNSRVQALVKTYKKQGGTHKNPTEFIEAQIMGRYKDGTPLTLWDGEDINKKPSWNDKKMVDFNSFDVDLNSSRITPNGTFDHLKDSKGLKCPFHAHIRKANPRIENDSKETPGLFLPNTPDIPDVNNVKSSPPAVIIRRGIPFKENENNQGMLFMCFQRDIQLQFSRIQNRWLNGKTYGSNQSSLDGIAGNNDTNKRTAQNWKKEYEKKDDFYFSFKDMIDLKGGEFFYAPRIDFFK